MKNHNRSGCSKEIISNNSLVNKLKSSSGESIAETLVAVLIAALALLMLAGTINSSSKLITNSKERMNQYYLANNNLTGETEEGTSLTATVSDGEALSQTWTVKGHSPSYPSADTKKIGNADKMRSYSP